MKLRPSWESASCAAIQQFSNILRNPKVYYRAHNSLQLAPILSQINPVHTTPSYLRSILICSSHPRLGLPCDLFPSGFLTRIQYALLFLPPACYMPCPSYPPWLDNSNYTWRTVQFMKLLIMQFSPTPYHFIPLRSTYSPQYPWISSAGIWSLPGWRNCIRRVMSSGMRSLVVR
jgi:hypothetical protein